MLVKGRKKELKQSNGFIVQAWQALYQNNRRNNNNSSSRNYDYDYCFIFAWSMSALQPIRASKQQPLTVLNSAVASSEGVNGLGCNEAML